MYRVPSDCNIPQGVEFRLVWTTEYGAEFEYCNGCEYTNNRLSSSRRGVAFVRKEDANKLIRN